MADLSGLTRLAVERGSMLATQRATRDRDDDARAGRTVYPLSAHVAAGLPTHLAGDMRDGMIFAREAVNAIRTHPDYDPATHGRTDDEIADMLLARARQNHPERFRSPG